MSAQESVGAHNTAHSVLIALEMAEDALNPSRCSASRLYVAIRCVDATLSFLAWPSLGTRERVAYRLEDLREIESMGVLAGNLAADSVVGRGITLAIHVAQCALAGVDPPADLVLGEARALARLGGAA